MPIILLPLVAFGSNALGLDEDRAGGLAGLVAGVVGAVFVFYMDRWLERHNPPRVLVDPQTGKQVAFKRRDSVFFIPMRFLWIPYAIGAVVGLFTMVVG